MIAIRVWRAKQTRSAHRPMSCHWTLASTAFGLAGLFGRCIPWDAVHEFNAHAGGSLLVARQITSVLLGYVFFCATYDFLMATYFYSPQSLARSLGEHRCAMEPRSKRIAVV